MKAIFKTGGKQYYVDSQEGEIDDDGVFGIGNGALKLAVHGVILEHVSHVIGSDQVIDADDFDILVVEAGTENETSDAAKTVDTNFDHSRCSSFNISPLSRVQAAVFQPLCPIVLLPYCILPYRLPFYKNRV